MLRCIEKRLKLDNTEMEPYLRNEILFEFRQEFQIKKIIWCESFFTHNSFHGLNIFTNGIASILIDAKFIEKKKTEKQ